MVCKTVMPLQLLKQTKLIQTSTLYVCVWVSGCLILRNLVLVVVQRWARLGWFMLLLELFLFIGQIFCLSMIVLVIWFYTLVVAAQSVLKNIIVIIDNLYKALSLQ